MAQNHTNMVHHVYIELGDVSDKVYVFSAGECYKQLEAATVQLACLAPPLRCFHVYVQHNKASV